MRNSRHLLAVLTIAALLFPAPASAYQTLGCQFNSNGSLKWKDATSGSSWATPGQNAISLWDATSSPLALTKVTTGANIAVADGNFGNLGFDGIILDTSQRDPTVYSCSGGTWDTTIVTWWNRYYADSYTSTKRKSVMVHELGHAFGLAHQSDLFALTSSSCSLTRTPATTYVASAFLVLTTWQGSTSCTDADGSGWQ